MRNVNGIPLAAADSTWIESHLVVRQDVCRALGRWLFLLSEWHPEWGLSCSDLRPPVKVKNEVHNLRTHREQSGTMVGNSTIFNAAL